MTAFFSRQRVPQTGRGTLNRVEEKKHAVVVGGGLAGVSAATILAEKGVAVTLLEKEAFLGGRVGAWTDKLKSGDPFEMERGFHAFFRQYYNLRNLLRRIDPGLYNLTPLEDYPVHGPDGYRESFRGLPKLAPMNVAALVMRTSTLTFRDLMKTNVKAALEMLSYDPDRTYARYDTMTAKDYLDSLNFPAHARRMLFDVFSHSFFNPEEEMSAGELLMMFHFYFLGNIEGLIFDVLNEPFSDALWRPFERYLKQIGVTIMLQTAAARIEPAQGGWKVFVDPDGQAIDADAVVLAATVPGLQAIVEASPQLNDREWRKSIADLALTFPFAVWRIWMDRPCKPDRYPFIGTAGLGAIDNISLYELFEGESRRWAMRTGGSVVEIHAYAVDPAKSETEVKEFFLQKLHLLYPETKDAKILEERFLWKQDCPAFGPGSDPNRPPVKTPFSGLTLAGDFVKIPIPSALMEKAATSGMMAANLLLSDWNVRGETLWSLPPKGLLARWMTDRKAIAAPRR